jgi:uncharacterized protein
MSISLYDASVPVFRQMLGNLSELLDKAEVHAKIKNFDPGNMLNSRLAPDMLTLTKQVQIACDGAKGAVARLAGVDIPKHEDNEISMADLKARIAKTLEFVNSIAREKIDGREDHDITIVLRDRSMHMKGLPFLMHWAFPNFFFHVTTAYNLLRHNGVEIGKKDFLGKVA